MKHDPDAWWRDAWKGSPLMNVKHEFKIGRRVLKPGDRFKVKGQRGQYLFRCFTTNTKTGKSWVEAVQDGNGPFVSFLPEDVK
jgi:hypothetical protein